MVIPKRSIWLLLLNIYNKVTGEAVSIENITAPYAYMPGVSSDTVDFDHGDYAIEMNGSSSAWVYTNGSFTYKISGVTVSVGGDILSVSKEIFKTKITTKAVRVGMRVYLSDL